MSDNEVDVVALKCVLYVDDMDRAISFYMDTFCFTSTTKSPEWSELAHAKGLSLGLHIRDGHDNEKTLTSLSIGVGNLNQAFDIVEKNGGQVLGIEEDTDYIKVGKCVDTENNVISLVQYL